MALDYKVFFGLVLLFTQRASGTSCQLDVTQDMLQRLLQTDAQGCETLWNNLQVHLYRAHQNLTDCERREQTSKATETPDTSCQTQLDDVKRRAGETLKKITSQMQSKLLMEQLESKKTQAAIKSLRADLKNVTMELKGHYQSLLLLALDMDSLRRGLKYYHLLKSLNEPNMANTMVKFAYVSPRHEIRRLENLLAVTRHLPTDAEKMELYRLIQPRIVQSKTQSLHYLAMVAALDISKIVFSPRYTNGNDRKLYDPMFNLILKRFKFQILGGNYRDIVEFATKYPVHFDQVEARIANINPKFWSAINFDQYVTYPNRLPKVKQRLEALRQIMLQIKQHNKKEFSQHLGKLARQVDICEKWMKQRTDELTGRDELVNLKVQFSELDKTKNYDYYLKLEVKPHKPAPLVLRRKGQGRPRSRSGLTGR